MIAAYVQHGQAERALQLYKQMLRDGVTPNNRTFVSVLQACGMLADKETFVYGQGVKVVSLELGRQIHSDACKEGHALDIYVGNTLVHMYGKCGSIVDAQKVFDGLLQRDVVSWTAIVAAYMEQGQVEKALQLYDHMREEGITPDARVFVSTLQACGMCAEMEDDVMVGGCPTLSTCLEKGRQVHADARKKGYDTDVFVGSTLVSMYGKFASISDAQDVFCGLSNQNVVSFNAMLATFMQLNKVEEALQLYQDMREQGVTPNERTFVSVIQACGRFAEQEEGTVLDVQTAAVKSLYMGRAMHAEAWTMGFTTDVFVGNALISMYGRCGSIMDAWSLFTELSHREVVSWNAMIGACSQQSEAERALNLYSQMQEEGVSPDNRTVVSTLQACGMLFENGDGEPSSFFLEKIRAIHANARMKGYVSDRFVGISLIDVYAKCGSIIDAQDVFDRLSRMSVLEWTAIITAHAQHGHAERAMQLYEQMCEEGITPNDRTLVSALQACGALAGKEDIAAGQSNKLKFLHMGKLTHAYAEKMGYSTVAGIENTLLSMYGKCGSFEDVQIVFDGMSSKSVVSWNVMLACHVQQSQAENVVQLYEQMKQEKFCSDAWTFVTVLQAYGILAEREEAVIIEEQSIKSRTLEMTKALHADCRKHGYNSDTFVSTTLISAYGKCGDVAEAQNVFEVLSCRKVVSWNVMLGAYVENGQVAKALQLYEQMQKEHVTLNEITAVYMLQVCSNVGSLTLLRQIHNVVFANQLDSRLFPASSLITAYGRCSSMMDAQKVFDALPKPDVVSWTALIAGYSREGNCAATLHTFEKMNLACIKPDAITYLAVLSACSHAGLVDAGADYFNSMVGYHGISPKLEHYVAMVDLFGRAGCFRRVADILSTMTMQPNMDIWLCLLSACRKHGMLALGEQAFRCAVHLQPRNPAAYSLITNMYADAGLWDLADDIKKLRATEGAWKQVGQCWIEHEQQVFSFVVGGCMDLSDGLYILIGNIRSKLKAEAYILETQNF